MRVGTLWFVTVLATLSLVGCAGPFGLTGMNAEQLKEWAKVKDANVTCVRAVYAGAIITMVSISVDKGIPAGVQIDDSCNARLMAEPGKK